MEKIIMPVARNMKELEKMVLDRMKKELPNATKEYCHKWYNNNSDIKEIVSETEFIQMANDAMQISMENGKLKAHIELFKRWKYKGKAFRTYENIMGRF